METWYAVRVLYCNSLVATSHDDIDAGDPLARVDFFDIDEGPDFAKNDSTTAFLKTIAAEKRSYKAKSVPTQVGIRQ